jgi:hypothetical protein
MDFLLTENSQLHTYAGNNIYNPVSMDDFFSPNYVSVDMLTANQTITTTSSDGGTYEGGAYNTIRFNNIVSDVDGCWNSETFRYTPKVPGVYQFCLNARVEASGNFLTDVVVNFVKSGANNWHGTELIHASNTELSVQASCATAMIEMNGTTDYVQAMVWLSTSDGNPAVIRGGVSGQQDERYSYMMARRLI